MGTVKGTSRRDRADITRRRILRAAHAEFLARGYHGATVTAIAKRARVAPQTVYFVFHSKSELVSAVIDDAVLGGDGHPVVPQASDWWAEMVAAPTSREALETFIRGAAPLLQAAAGVSEIVRAAALTDLEVRAVHRKHERLQLEGYGEVVDLLVAKGCVRDELSRDQAVDVLITLCGDATYVQLAVDRAWPHERIVEWLLDVTPYAVLRPST